MDAWKELLTPFVIFIGATILGFVWFQKRGEDPEKILQIKLRDSAAEKVKKHLEKERYITAEQVEKLLHGHVARDRWFRKVMRIDDPKLYAKGLIRYMVEAGMISYAGKDGYELKK